MCIHAVLYKIIFDSSNSYTSVSYIIVVSLQLQGFLMNNTDIASIRSQLTERRERLRLFMNEERKTNQLIDLLKEVESAIARLDNGTYGICEICNEEIEHTYLHAEPVVRICLSHLSEEEQRSVERDLQLAAQIQGKLLPVQHMPFDGWDISYRYEPLGPVSGDYCDLIKPMHEENDLYFFFGDVSGKGVAASLLMSHLHGIFRSLLSMNLPLQQIVESANRLFTESTSSSNFATIACGRVSRAGEVEICNAGHCYPLVVQKDEIRSIESTGLPLGMFFNAKHQARKLQLQHGDTLFLYTDGLTESRNSSGDEYSEARLSAFVAKEHSRAPAELIDFCINDVTRFRAGTPRTDDLTIMVMRKK